MQGWIIYKETETFLKPASYETQCFIEVAEKQNISLKVLMPEQFDLIVTREDRKKHIR